MLSWGERPVNCSLENCYTAPGSPQPLRILSPRFSHWPQTWGRMWAHDLHSL